MNPPHPQALERLKTNAAAWIAAADTKAAALLAVSNILLGAVFLADINTKAEGAEALRFAFIGLVLLLHVVIAAGVLWPRLNRAEILKVAQFPSPLPRSPSFYGDVAGLPYNAFASILADEAAQKADAVEQAYVLAVIARQKMIAYRWSIVIFVACLLSFCGVAAFSGVTDQSSKPSSASANIEATKAAKGAP